MDYSPFFVFSSFTAIATAVTIIIFFGRIFRLPPKFSFSIFAAGTAAIRFCLNIKVNYCGNIPVHQGIIASNHRSYIDIVLIPSRVPYVIVAKKQVRSWPVIGITGIALKVIFVDRDSATSRKNTRAAIKDRLGNGLSVLIFPEGTTHTGPEILPFKPGMFHTAAAEGFTLTPVAIEYEKQEMAWVGTDTFIGHFFRAFSKLAVKVAVSFGEPLHSAASAGNENDSAPADERGEELRKQAERWVADEALSRRQIWDREPA